LGGPVCYLAGLWGSLQLQQPLVLDAWKEYLAVENGRFGGETGCSDLEVSVVVVRRKYESQLILKSDCASVCMWSDHRCLKSEVGNDVSSCLASKQS
jgi:hypothetical protein